MDEEKKKVMILENKIQEILDGNDRHSCAEALMCALVDVLISGKFTEDKFDVLFRDIAVIYKARLKKVVQE